MFLEIYDFDTAHFLSTQELAYEAALRKTKVKIDPSTDIDILLMIMLNYFYGIVDR